MAEHTLADMLPLPPILLRVLRVFRILRILRLLKGAKELRNLIVTMFLSFPSLINVGSLLAIVMFMYAVLGLSLFTFVAHGEMITPQRNFETFGSSCLLLFQVLTGDAWSGLMADAMLEEASGECSVSDGNCGTPLALPYFITFQLLGSFVFLNLVVAVIVENFSSLGQLNPELVSHSDVEGFKEAWTDFDPDGDSFMATADLPDLVLALPPPLGLKGVKQDVATSRRLALKMCLQLKLKQSNGTVHFSEVLAALTKYNFASRLDEGGVADLDELSSAMVQPAPAEAGAASAASTSLSPEKLALLKLRGRSSVSTGAGDYELLAENSAAADEFRDDLPSIRRVFAIGVIDKHLRNYKQAMADRAAGCGDNGPRGPISNAPPGTYGGVRGLAKAARAQPASLHASSTGSGSTPPRKGASSGHSTRGYGISSRGVLNSFSQTGRRSKAPKGNPLDA